MLLSILNDHERWMRLALEEANLAYTQGEVPVGAIVVRSGAVLGKGHNQMRSLSDPTAHAEMIAISAAANTTDDARLEEADIYVTLEPCSMCAGALVLSRIKRLYFAVDDPKTGACGSVLDIVRDPRINHSIEVYRGILEMEASELLTDFFSGLRTKHSKR
ncbi:tRNA adenosine(34) deaminase TadA [Calditrichota bacterium]